MKKSKLPMPTKGVSWPDLILEIEFNEEGWELDPSKDKGRPFPIERAQQLRVVISGNIKLRFPERTYKTNKEIYKGDIKEFQGQKVLMIRWIK